MMSVQSLKSTHIRTIHVVFIVGLIALAAFNGALVELVGRWAEKDEYSHGFFIPMVTIWLLWVRREALFASIGSPSWVGPVMILVAAGMHVAGVLTSTFFLSQLGFVLALIGIVLGIGGVSLLRITFIPIFFLFFAIPLPTFIDATLSLQLQLISSRLGVFFIQLFQIPVYLNGNIIDLGIYQLQIVDACSGLRYLFPLFSLSFLAAYLFHAPIWQRAVVLFSSIPITIIMNGLRIGIIGVTVDQWGIQMADGVLHFFEGWIIFIACAALLGVEIAVFARFSGRSFFEAFHLRTVAVHPSGGRLGESRFAMPLIACLLILCTAALAGSFISDRLEIIPERSRFVTFPIRLGQWQGYTSTLDPRIEHIVAAEDYMLSDYRKSDGKAVNLYMAYYASQQKGESPHSPLICIPGDGWIITRLARTTYGNSNIEQPLNRALIERDGIKQVVYYWYEERGRRIASEYWSKWYLLSDAITQNRSDGALVRLITTIFPGETERDADGRLMSFMQELLPNLGSYLPGRETPQIRAVRHTSQDSNHV
jgi:exosortase D (VPLPA-CTERM-specific)